MAPFPVGCRLWIMLKVFCVFITVAFPAGRKSAVRFWGNSGPVIERKCTMNYCSTFPGICQNGGSCKDNGCGGYCVCSIEFTGHLCETSISDVTTATTLSGSISLTVTPDGFRNITDGVLGTLPSVLSTPATINITLNSTVEVSQNRTTQASGTKLSDSNEATNNQSASQIPVVLTSVHIETGKQQNATLKPSNITKSIDMGTSQKTTSKSQSSVSANTTRNITISPIVTSVSQTKSTKPLNSTIEISTKQSQILTKKNTQHANPEDQQIQSSTSVNILDGVTATFSPVKSTTVTSTSISARTSSTTTRPIDKVIVTPKIQVSQETQVKHTVENNTSTKSVASSLPSVTYKPQTGETQTSIPSPVTGRSPEKKTTEQSKDTPKNINILVSNLTTSVASMGSTVMHVTPIIETGHPKREKSKTSVTDKTPIAPESNLKVKFETTSVNISHSTADQVTIPSTEVGSDITTHPKSNISTTDITTLSAKRVTSVQPTGKGDNKTRDSSTRTVNVTQSSSKATSLTTRSTVEPINNIAIITLKPYHVTEHKNESIMKPTQATGAPIRTRKTSRPRAPEDTIAGQSTTVALTKTPKPRQKQQKKKTSTNVTQKPKNEKNETKTVNPKQEKSTETTMKPEPKKAGATTNPEQKLKRTKILERHQSTTSNTNTTETKQLKFPKTTKDLKPKKSRQTTMSTKEKKSKPTTVTPTRLTSRPKNQQLTKAPVKLKHEKHKTTKPAKNRSRTNKQTAALVSQTTETPTRLKTEKPKTTSNRNILMQASTTTTSSISSIIKSDSNSTVKKNEGPPSGINDILYSRDMVVDHMSNLTNENISKLDMIFHTGRNLTVDKPDSIVTTDTPKNTIYPHGVSSNTTNGPTKKPRTTQKTTLDDPRTDAHSTIPKTSTSSTGKPGSQLETKTTETVVQPATVSLKSPVTSTRPDVETTFASSTVSNQQKVTSTIVNNTTTEGHAKLSTITDTTNIGNEMNNGSTSALPDRTGNGSIFSSTRMPDDNGGSSEKRNNIHDKQSGELLDVSQNNNGNITKIENGNGNGNGDGNVDSPQFLFQGIPKVENGNDHVLESNRSGSIADDNGRLSANIDNGNGRDRTRTGLDILREIDNQNKLLENGKLEMKIQNSLLPHMLLHSQMTSGESTLLNNNGNAPLPLPVSTGDIENPSLGDSNEISLGISNDIAHKTTNMFFNNEDFTTRMTSQVGDTFQSRSKNEFNSADFPFFSQTNHEMNSENGNGENGNEHTNQKWREGGSEWNGL